MTLLLAAALLGAGLSAFVGRRSRPAEPVVPVAEILAALEALRDDIAALPDLLAGQPVAAPSAAMKAAAIRR